MDKGSSLMRGLEGQGNNSEGEKGKTQRETQRKHKETQGHRMR